MTKEMYFLFGGVVIGMLFMNLLTLANPWMAFMLFCLFKECRGLM